MYDIVSKCTSCKNEKKRIKQRWVLKCKNVYIILGTEKLNLRIVYRKSCNYLYD